jgi:TolB-like protein/cytochrome c-type biogenesis protein CcmH/NrfG
MIERKLAAILNADVVSYTRLMADDEVATLDTLQSHWSLVDGHVRHHGGRVVDKVGDNLLAEFPSAVSAVHSAVEIQRELESINSSVRSDRRMLLRIGLNLGDLIVDGDRIVGDGVNVAARIQTSAKPGGVSISSTMMDQIEGKLPYPIKSQGELNFKNVSRPVPVFEVEIRERGESADVGPEPQPRQDDPHLAGFAEGNAIAVLPFRNLSRDQDQEYFADGLAEDLITSLATLRMYPVIARHSSFTYKDQTVDARQVGRELGAHYIVTGSVRKAGSRMRVNAELVDTADAHQIWSGRYDREISDIFDLQDEITLAIAGSVGPALLQSEREHAMRRMPQNLDAWESLHRSMWHLFQYSREHTEKAQTWALRALELQPDLAQAYSMIAFSHMYEIIYQWSGDPQRSRKLAAKAAEKAVELNKDDPIALTALGYAHSLVGEYERSIEALERALAINPSSAMTYWALGSSLAQAGQVEEGIAKLEQAIRLSPQDPLMHEFIFNIGSAHFIAGRYEKAAEFARKSLATKPGQPGTLRLLAAASAFLGKTKEAVVALDKMMRAAPSMSEQHLRSFLPSEVAGRYVEGLRLAGWQG